MARRSIIVLSDYSFQKEAIAAAAITPGFLVEYTSAGKVQAHSTAGGNAAKSFAVENDINGDPISTAYSADDTVLYRTFLPGDEVYAYLASGQSVSKGAFLESDGNGYLQAHSPASEGAEYPLGIIGVAKETVNATSAAARIIVEIV